MSDRIDFSDFPGAESVFSFFSEISSIPRPSGKRAGIADYLTAFAKKRGLDFIRDGADNVIIKKPASVGLEDRPTVILQAHTDMVPAKTADCTLDLENDGLALLRDGDFLSADGTTLGADDGIGVAYILALLDGDFSHPAIEALFTSDEEIGLIGAAALNPDSLDGRILINLDSDDEGVFIAGCAGGATVSATLPIKREPSSMPAYAVSVCGLIGGHSGADIDKGRENAAKLFAELFREQKGARIAALAGGSADNAIMRKCTAVIYSDCPDFLDTVGSFYEKTAARISSTEPNFRVTAEPIFSDIQPLDEKSSDSIISILSDMPNGIIRMSRDIDGLVETSLNLGILSLEENSLKLSSSVRSSKDGEKKALCKKLLELYERHGASASVLGDYPGWDYSPASHLRDVMSEAYRHLYSAEPTVMAIHAGLECGILASKLPGLDCVSIGPDCFDIHTTEERLSLSSAARVWDFIKEILTRI